VKMSDGANSSRIGARSARNRCFRTEREFALLPDGSSSIISTWGVTPDPNQSVVGMRQPRIRN
jgi:hypothetical protein